jgi:hypothetical protein
VNSDFVKPIAQILDLALRIPTLATLLNTEVDSVVEYSLVPNDFYKDILCQTSMPFSERGRFSKQVRT